MYILHTNWNWTENPTLYQIPWNSLRFHGDFAFNYTAITLTWLFLFLFQGQQRTYDEIKHINGIQTLTFCFSDYIEFFISRPLMCWNVLTVWPLKFSSHFSDSYSRYITEGSKNTGRHLITYNLFDFIYIYLYLYQRSDGWMCKPKTQRNIWQ